MSARKAQVPCNPTSRRQILLLATLPIVGMAAAWAASEFLFDGSSPPAMAAAEINKRAALPLVSLKPRYESDDPSSADLSPPLPEEILPEEIATPNLSDHLAALLANIREIAALPESPEREAKLKALINSLPEGDLSALVIFLGKKLPFGSQDAVLSSLVSRWADIDVLAAASWINGLQSGPLRQQTANIVAILWANKDIAGVSRWVAQWPEGQDRNEVVTNIAYEAARKSPTQALNLAMDLLPDEPLSKLVIYATSQWATVAPEDAAKWTEQIDDDKLRNQALVSVATAWAATDPNAAAQLALTEIPAGRQQQDAVVGIVERSTQIDPKGTADWVEQFGAGTLRDTAIQNMVSIWTDKDPSGAAQWLESLPSGQFRNSAVGAYVNKVAIASPSEAARRAQTLPPQ
jgi:hypothetical protein